MKKICLVAVSAFMILMLCGCGKTQVLSCTQTPEGTVAKFEMTFKGEVVKKMHYDYDTDLSTFSDETIDAFKKQDFCSMTKENLSQYKDAFDGCKQEIKDKHLILSAEFDVTKVSGEEAGKKVTIEETKVQFEAQGFACTIK